MSDEEKLPVVDVQSVQKINLDDGDALLVTLPPQSDAMPLEVRNKYIESVHKSFTEIFKDKKVRVIIVPYGLKVELIRTSTLEDKDDA